MLISTADDCLIILDMETKKDISILKRTFRLC